MIRQYLILYNTCGPDRTFVRVAAIALLVPCCRGCSLWDVCSCSVAQDRESADSVLEGSAEVLAWDVV